jgi:hypothetical protein
VITSPLALDQPDLLNPLLIPALFKRGVQEDIDDVAKLVFA